MKSTENPIAPRSTERATPIFVAAQNNHIEIVKILMKATDNPNAAMNNGSTPMSIATQKNHQEIVQLLENYRFSQMMLKKREKEIKNLFFNKIKVKFDDYYEKFR